MEIMDTKFQNTLLKPHLTSRYTHEKLYKNILPTLSKDIMNTKVFM